MKRLILLSLLCHFCIINNDLQANEKRIKSEIKEALVYMNGAQLTATASVPVKAGYNELIFEALPPSINPSSIRVKGEGDYTILSVSHRLNYLSTENNPPEIVAISDSMELLQTKLEYQRGLRKVYDQEEQLLLSNQSIKGENTGVSIAELEKAANLFRNRLTELQSKKQDIKAKEKKLTESIEALKKQLAELNSKKQSVFSEIVVVVSSKSALTSKMLLIYNVTDCGWTPSYDIRATDTDSPIKLTLKANIFQTTGFPWNQVKLTVSTGDPTISGDKPQLAPWWLQVYNPYVKKKSAAYSGSMPQAAVREQEVQKSEAQEEAYFAQDAVLNVTAKDFTQVNEAQTSVQYDVSIPYSILSNGKAITVELQEYAVPATYTYYTAPKLISEAFLLAKITGSEKYNLIPAEASIFFEDAYVGKSYIDPYQTNDTLDISLGRDKNVTVVRTPLTELQEKKLLGTHRKQSFMYEISVRNKKKQEIGIIIEDQIPISNNKEIEVETIESSKAKEDKVNGKLIWELKIAPGQTQKTRFGYSVKYPKEMSISNL